MFQQKIQQDALSGSGTVGDYHYGDDSDDDDDMYGFDVDDAIYPIRYSTTFSFQLFPFSCAHVWSPAYCDDNIDGQKNHYGQSKHNECRQDCNNPEELDMTN